MGTMFGDWSSEVTIVQAVLIMFWFMLPGAIFFNALNDVYDWETARLNPRKKVVEMASDDTEKNKLIVTSILAWLTSVVLLPFVSPLFLSVFIVWSVMIVAYNVPPLRFKAQPVVNVLFGGVAHYVPLLVMGFIFTSGVLPPLEYILLGVLFMAAMHTAAGGCNGCSI